jgi:hypothetical protein
MSLKQTVRTKISQTYIDKQVSLRRLSGAHPASYPMGNGGSFTGGEAAGA